MLKQKVQKEARRFRVLRSLHWVLHVSIPKLDITCVVINGNWCRKPECEASSRFHSQRFLLSKYTLLIYDGKWKPIMAKRTYSNFPNGPNSTRLSLTRFWLKSLLFCASGCFVPSVTYACVAQEHILMLMLMLRTSISINLATTRVLAEFIANENTGTLD